MITRVLGCQFVGEEACKDKLTVCLLESSGSRAELTRSRGCLNGEQRKWSGSQRYIPPRSEFALSLEFRETEPLRSRFSSR
jgi:hypothetical protein